MVDPVMSGTSKPVRAPGAQNIGKESPSAPPVISRNPRNRLNLASEIAGSGPPLDAGKIASLKTSIASGQYQINLDAIADSIIRFGGSDSAYTAK